MKEEKHYIGNIFKEELSSFEVGNESQGWTSLAGKLNKSKGAGLNNNWVKVLLGTLLSTTIVLSILFLLQQDSVQKEDLNSNLSNQSSLSSLFNDIKTPATISDPVNIVEQSNSGIFADSSSSSGMIVEIDLRTELENSGLSSEDKVLAAKNTIVKSDRTVERNNSGHIQPLALNYQKESLQSDGKTSVGSTLTDVSAISNDAFDKTESTQTYIAEKVGMHKTSDVDRQNIPPGYLNTFNLKDLVCEQNYLGEKLPFNRLGREDEFSSGFRLTFLPYFDIQEPRIALSTGNAENYTGLNQLESNLGLPSSSGYGMIMEVSKFNFRFSTGLGLLQIQQDANYITQQLETKTTQHLSFKPYSYQIFDTIYYCNVFGNDTVWEYHLEAETMYGLDSVVTLTVDTTINYQNNTFENIYKFIDVPLIAAYSFNHGRLSTTVSGGIIGSFRWKVKGISILSVDGEEVKFLDYEDFPSVRPDLYGEIESRYYLASKYFIFGKAYYRQALKPFMSHNNIDYQYSAYGIKLGVGVHIN